MSGQQIDHLVKMANQIALNFGERRNLSEAAHKTAEHLKKFWTPDMRQQLATYAEEDGEGDADEDANRAPGDGQGGGQCHPQG